MIRVSDSWAVVSRLRRVLARPRAFRDVAVCVQFIDDRNTDLLHAVADRAIGLAFTIRLIATPAVASRFGLSTPVSYRAVRLIARAEMHAKVYLADWHRFVDREVLVTSAILTQSGLQKNTDWAPRERRTGHYRYANEPGWPVGLQRIE